MSSDARIQIKVFKCLGTWFSVDALPQEAVVQSGLLMAPFKALVSSAVGNGLEQGHFQIKGHKD